MLRVPHDRLVRIKYCLFSLVLCALLFYTDIHGTPIGQVILQIGLKFASASIRTFATHHRILVFFTSVSLFLSAVAEPLDTFSIFTRLTRRVHDSGFRSLALRFDLSLQSDYRPPAGHTHGGAAKERFDVIHNIRARLQHRYHMVDPSLAKRDSIYDTSGYRHVYSVKDLSQSLPLRTFHKARSTLRKHKVITLIDQDYYFNDLQQFSGTPLVIYTMRCDSLAGRGINSTYYFSEVDNVVERIEGGAVYNQRLFDYSSDQLVMRGNWFGGLLSNFTVYDVHSKAVGTNKMVVFLCPASTHYVPLWLYTLLMRVLVGQWLRVPLLDKLRSVQSHGQFLVGKFYRQTGLWYSIKRRADMSPDSAVDLPESVFMGLSYLSKNLTRSWSAGEVERYTSEWGHPIRGPALPTVCEFFSTPFVPSNSVNVFIPPDTSLGDRVTDVGKLKGRLAAPAIVTNPAVVLSHNDAADRSYVNERMLPNRNSKKFSPQQIVWAGEYVKQMSRQTDFLVPLTLEEVLALQDKPLQRARNKKELGHLPKENPGTKTNLKSEATLKEGPGRGVNTCETSHTWITARYAYAAKRVTSRLHHYVVGLPPLEIAKRVRELARNAHALGCVVFETDFSKLDETISEDMRVHIFNPLMYRMFKKEYHAELKTALDNDWGCRGRCGKIKIPDMGPKNESGSGFTTAINTAVAPFPLYCYYRGQGLSIVDAFKRMGVAFGDDGLSIGCDAQSSDEGSAALVAEASSIGLNLKVLVHKPNEPLFFLGRSYPSPMTSLVSLALPSTSLSKLPVTLNELPQSLVDRFRGYFVTEKHVPIVREYIEAVARVKGFALTFSKKDLEKLRDSDKDTYYRVSAGPYPYEAHDDTVIMDRVCTDLRLTQREVEERCDALRSIKNVEDFDKILINNTRISKYKIQRSA